MPKLLPGIFHTFPPKAARNRRPSDGPENGISYTGTVHPDSHREHPPVFRPAFPESERKWRVQCSRLRTLLCKRVFRSFKQPGGKITFSAIGQKNNDPFSGIFRTFGKFQSSKQCRSGRNTDQNAFSCRTITGSFSCKTGKRLPARGPGYG